MSHVIELDHLSASGEVVRRSVRVGAEEDDRGDEIFVRQPDPYEDWYEAYAEEINEKTAMAHIGAARISQSSAKEIVRYANPRLRLRRPTCDGRNGYGPTPNW